MLNAAEARAFVPNALHRADPQMVRQSRALTGRQSESLKGARYTELYDGGVAVLDIHGAVFRHADSMETSGAMSTESVFRELQVARASKNVNSLILHMDTPGGDATAGNEVAQFIHEFAQEKPVETYIEGLGASLGYYWASATKRITMSRMALAGSIGVVLGVPIPHGKTEFGDNVLIDSHGSAVAEIVSSVSPLKRANAMTKDGAAYYRNMVNQLADVFVQDVARFRGLNAAELPSQYGDGGVYVAAQALEMGLCDEVGSFDTVLNRMIDGDVVRGSSMTGSNGKDSGPPAAPPASEAQANEGGEDVGLKDLLSRGAKPDAAAPVEQGGLPINEVLAHLAEQRPTIEQSVEAAAANAILTTFMEKHKQGLSAQHQFACAMQAALADDALYGGTVSYVNAKGEDVQGTRAEMMQSLLDALPKESLAGQRVSAVQDGSVQGKVLKPGTSESQTVAEPGEMGSDDYEKDELLAMGTIGKAADEKGSGKRA